MTISKRSDSHIISILNQASGGVLIASILREHKISSATFYKLRSRYEGMDLPMSTKLKELALENARLKKMYDEERLRTDILKAVLKKVRKPSQRREMAKIISEEKDISIRTACKIFCVSEI